MDKYTFGLTMLVVGMGGTLLTLGLMSVIMSILKKIFPHGPGTEEVRDACHQDNIPSVEPCFTDVIGVGEGRGRVFHPLCAVRIRSRISLKHFIDFSIRSSQKRRNEASVVNGFKLIAARFKR